LRKVLSVPSWFLRPYRSWLVNLLQYIFCNTLQDQVIAHPGQYLIVEYRDGNKEHIAGMCLGFFSEFRPGVVVRIENGITCWGPGEREKEFRSFTAAKIFKPWEEFRKPQQPPLESRSGRHVCHVEHVTDHRLGPASIYFNPVVHSCISVAKALRVLPPSGLPFSQIPEFRSPPSGLLPPAFPIPPGTQFFSFPSALPHSGLLILPPSRPSPPSPRPYPP
jgi:hypothetical protein